MGDLLDVLDVRGHSCPIPLMRARRYLRTAASGRGDHWGQVSNLLGNSHINGDLPYNAVIEVVTTNHVIDGRRAKIAFSHLKPPGLE